MKRCLGRRPPPDQLRDTNGGLGRVLMLPYTEHTPASLGEQAISLKVAFPVTDDLLSPVIGVRLRHGVVLGAAMPEAAVEEDRDLCPGEHQVSGTADRRKRADGNSVPQAECVGGPSKSEFGPGVTSFVGLHALTYAGTGRSGRSRGSHVSNRRESDAVDVTGPGRSKIRQGPSAGSTAERWK